MVCLVSGGRLLVMLVTLHKVLRSVVVCFYGDCVLRCICSALWVWLLYTVDLVAVVWVLFVIYVMRLWLLC